MHQQPTPLNVGPHLTKQAIIEQAMQAVTNGADPNAPMHVLCRLNPPSSEPSWWNASLLRTMILMRDPRQVKNLLVLGASTHLHPHQPFNLINEAIHALLPAILDHIDTPGHRQGAVDSQDHMVEPIIDIIQCLLDHGVRCDPQGLEEEHQRAVLQHGLKPFTPEGPFQVLFAIPTGCSTQVINRIADVLLPAGARPDINLIPLNSNWPGQEKIIAQLQARYEQHQLTNSVTQESLAPSPLRKM